MSLSEVAAFQGSPEKSSFIHSEAPTHRDDLPAHAQWFEAGVTEEVSIDGNGFPMVLISPASIIAKKESPSFISGCQGPL